MKKWLWQTLTIAAVLAAVALAGARWLMPPEVLVTRPTRGDALQAIYATGTVEASVTIRIAPQQPGRLMELGADEGDKVHTGQVLARLDDRDLHAALAELQARARYAEQQHRRLEALATRGFVSTDQLEQARSTLDAARAAVQRATEQLRFMTMKSPADGIVIRRDGEVGDFLPANQTLFYLAKDHSPPRVDTDVDEEDIARVRVGQEVLIHADAFPDRTFVGRVGEITPKGDPVARNYRVRVHLDDNTPLMIGMTAEANIVLAHHTQALLVPATALDGNKVWLVRAGRAVMQNVSIGAKGAGHTEITAGLTDSDTILVQALAGLRTGQRVRSRFVGGNTAISGSASGAGS